MQVAHARGGDNTCGGQVRLVSGCSCTRSTCWGGVIWRFGPCTCVVLCCVVLVRLERWTGTALAGWFGALHKDARTLRRYAAGRRFCACVCVLLGRNETRVHTVPSPSYSYMRLLTHPSGFGLETQSTTQDEMPDAHILPGFHVWFRGSEASQNSSFRRWLSLRFQFNARATSTIRTPFHLFHLKCSCMFLSLTFDHSFHNVKLYSTVCIHIKFI